MSAPRALDAPSGPSDPSSSTPPNVPSGGRPPLRAAFQVSLPASPVGPRHQQNSHTPAVQWLNRIMLDAAARNASDLHIERGRHDWRIRLRIDGVLHPIETPPTHLRDALLARIKALAGLDIAEQRLPQDGRLHLQVQPDRSEAFRVSTLPTVHGEKVVLRRLETLPALLDMGAIGLSTEQEIAIRDALHAPYGMVLVTGPTGSGKTLSLFSFLQAINTPAVNICTVEDPVELQLPGINQVSIREKAGLGFPTVLRAFLRQDPDVMMIGEIRDAETADIAVKAALTGHRVLSTLHTNDAPSTIVRLRDIGVAPYKLASALRLISAQRLVRRLCPACREPDRRAVCAMSRAQSAWCAASTGCAACHGIGYRGRVAIHQVMPITDALRDRIVGNGGVAALDEQAQKDGMLTLMDAALRCVESGDTSLAEAYQAAGTPC